MKWEPQADSPIVQRAREVAALVRDARKDIDQLGRLPDAVLEAIIGAQLFRMAVPASIGGGEVDVFDYSRVVEEIAKADASTAWCVMQAAISGTLAANMEREAAREVFGDPRIAVAAGTPTPTMGRAEAMAGGYRVSGRFAFASGCRHSTWMVARCHVYENGERRESRGPWVNLLVPADETRIEGSWDVAGMRATSSDTYAIEDAFVPERFAVEFSREKRQPGPLYRVGDLALAHLSMASAALGMAQDCLSEFAALAAGKRVAWTGTPLAELGGTQVDIARVTAQVDAALALRDQAAGKLWAAAVSNTPPSPDFQARMRLAIIHGVDVGVEAVNTIYRLSGTTGIFAGHPIQRHFQDVNVLSQQIVGRWSYYETVGKSLLGQEFDAGWL